MAEKILFKGIACSNFVKCQEIEKIHGKRPPAYVAFDRAVNCNVWCVCGIAKTKEWVILLS